MFYKKKKEKEKERNIEHDAARRKNYQTESDTHAPNLLILPTTTPQKVQFSKNIIFELLYYLSFQFFLLKKLKIWISSLLMNTSNCKDPCLLDFEFVVEDDSEVSPLYYQFLKGLTLNSWIIIVITAILVFEFMVLQAFTSTIKVCLRFLISLFIISFLRFVLFIYLWKILWCFIIVSYVFLLE